MDSKYSIYISGATRINLKAVKWWGGDKEFEKKLIFGMCLVVKRDYS